MSSSIAYRPWEILPFNPSLLALSKVVFFLR
jgi:hypothetical protein